MTPLLVVPTRNRPKNIAALLTYLGRFYPGTSVVVADGSDSAVQDQVARLCSDCGSSVAVEFRPYPKELPLFERLLDLVLSLDDDVLALGADDDYPLMDSYAEAAAKLIADAGLSIVVPFDVMLKHTVDNRLTARLMQSRPIVNSTAAARLNAFSRWKFATSYGAARRNTMVQRYRSLAYRYCSGFVDFQAGAEDCIEGRIGAIASMSAIRTHSYRGSYMRAEGKLIFLRRSGDILAIMGRLAERIAEVDGINLEIAEAAVHSAMNHNIAEVVGAGAKTRTGFAGSRLARDSVVQSQFAQFYDMFSSGTEVQVKHHEKLNYVVKTLLSPDSMDSDDAKGNYETL